MSPWLIYANVLVASSEEDILVRVGDILGERGFNCHPASSATDTLRLLKVIKFDLLLTSMYLSDRDATYLCRAIRRDSRMPILVYGLRNDPWDEVACLEAGADDYIDRGCEPSVLIARVRALLRRVKPILEEEQEQTIGDLDINEARFQAFVNGKSLKLTGTEYKLLKLLASEENYTVSRDEILQKVWDTAYLGDKRVVDTHIRNLRRKLQDVNSTVLISSVRGVGYRLISNPTGVAMEDTWRGKQRSDPKPYNNSLEEGDHDHSPEKLYA